MIETTVTGTTTLRRRLAPAALAMLLACTGLAQAREAAVEVEELATGLRHPWGMAFLPGTDAALITEKPGELRVWRRESGLSEPIAGVPEVYARSQGGLLDVAVSPDFGQDRLVYLSYAEAGENGKSGTAVGRGRLSEDLRTLQDFRVLFRQEPKLSIGQHYGSRLAFDRDGMLFITLGENNQRPTAQDLDKLQGKTVRLHADGTVPKDNPFVGKEGARPEIWSYGHRNAQGMALHPQTGEIWQNEHGAQGGDEINIARAGKNYGWPLATHGVNYGGNPIPEARGQTVPGTEPPHHQWTPSPAFSGMAFYDHERYPQWKNSLFMGALRDRNLLRLTLEGERIAGEERLLDDRGERIRDVRVGPDGAVYVLTDAADGKLLRVTPR